MRYAITITLALVVVLASAPAMSRTNGGQWVLNNGNLQKRANSDSGDDGIHRFPGCDDFHPYAPRQRGRGIPTSGWKLRQFWVSRSFPLYLEGNIAYSRYDPTFIATNGVEEREIPAEWKP